MDYELIYADKKLVLFPEGRIDTTNAATVEAEINDIRGKEDYSKIVMDFGKVEYISSAGLRTILRLRKAEPTFEIVNVGPENYEVFDMTGFTEMMPISKAYRNLSVEGCEVIGEGSNGIVYRYTDDIIIKVYKNNDALEEIHRERELARTALIMGVNTAIPYDVVKVGDHYGSVFELLSAASITKLIIRYPENMDKYVQIFVDMLKDIHNTEVTSENLPSIKNVYAGYAEFLKDHLTEQTYDKLIALIDNVPDSNRMIHGDYHTNNVHYANNEAILIDMDTIAVGNPVFEFASIFLAYIGFNELDASSSMKFLKLDKETCAKIYDMILDKYFADEDKDAMADKIRLLGYTRLLRRTIRRQPELKDEISRMKSAIEELVEKVDDLII